MYILIRNKDEIQYKNKSYAWSASDPTTVGRAKGVKKTDILTFVFKNIFFFSKPIFFSNLLLLS